MVWLLEKSTCTIWMAMSWLNRILKWYIYLYIYMLIKAFAIYMYFDTLTNLKLFYLHLTNILHLSSNTIDLYKNLRFLSFFPKSIKYQVSDLLISETVWKYLTKNKDLRAFDHLKKKTIDFISSHSDSWRRSQRHL